MPKKIKMVSLDTSSKKTGYGYFENGKLIESGVLDHEKEKDVIIRVEDMCIDIIEHLKRFQPDIVVIEQPPYCNSPATLIMLSEIVGCAKGWAITHYAEFVEYKVNEWRKLVAGKEENIPTKREAAKEWDKEKFTEIFKRKPVNDDEADAVLIGIARIKAFI